jgi:multicomponent Na+:H+ antiporter subunit F
MAASALVIGLIPCGIVCLRRTIMDRLVALKMARIIAMLVLVLFAEGLQRCIYFDVALTLTILNLAGTLAFVHFLQRWL